MKRLSSRRFRGTPKGRIRLQEVLSQVYFSIPRVYFVPVLQRKSSDTGVVYYISPVLSRAGVPHAFSTRIGGVSTGPFDSLNLGNPAPTQLQDEKQRIQENYRRLEQAIGLRGKTRCWVHQVHGPDVVFVRRDHEFASGARADALDVGDAVEEDPAGVFRVDLVAENAQELCGADAFLGEIHDLDETVVDETLGVVLKYQDDVQKIKGDVVTTMLGRIRAGV